VTGFRRLVLELGHGAADPATMREAAAFAQLLDAELHALFVEDETLLHASAMPFAREISTLSLQWRKLEPDRLAVEMRAAAGHARRRLMEIATATGVKRDFEIRRGDFALRMTETCIASDIVVLASPPRETTAGYRLLHESARQSPASILYLPPRSGRRHGPVVAVVTGMHDPALAVARQIATQGRERLVVLTIGQAIADLTTRVLPGAAASDIAAALGGTRERLIVMTRDTSKGDAPELAATLGVAVLLVEPVRSVANAG
jgi:hypothetical protein